MLRTQRIYDHDQDYQSYRILVDRLWPRGMSKVKAQLNEWTKEIAPSADLRQWFNHDPQKFADFRRAYLKELAQSPATADFTANAKEQLAAGDVILLYGAKDTTHNQTVVLKEFLEQQLGQTN